MSSGPLDPTPPLANAIVVFHLNYCSVVYLNVTDDLQTRLQKLQNSCVRYVCGVKRSKHITPLRKKLDWIDVWTKRAYFMAMKVYNAFSLGQPSYLVALLEKNQSRTSGRAPREISVPESRTDTGLKSFRAQSARLSVARH